MADQEPIEWIDPPSNTKERQVMTSAQLNVPGLRMYGHHMTAKAIAALYTHYHKNCFEITYIVHGNVTFSVEGKKYPLSGGDLFITKPNEIHDTGLYPMSIHEMYWFQLENVPAEDFLFLSSSAAYKLSEMLMNMSARVIKMDAEKAEDLLSTVFRLFQEKTDLARMEATIMLGHFLCETLRRAERIEFRLMPDIGRAVNYIFDHLQDDISMETLAEISLLSVSRFKQKFKDQIGSSPREFINYQKVEASKELLMEGKNITDTAMEMGFSSSNYFSSVFRRFTILSPSQYVKSTREANSKRSRQDQF